VLRLAINALLFVLFAASTLQAQITTSRVNVLVTGARCGELKNVFLVIDGDDVEDRWIRLEPAGACRWTADLGEGGTLSTALSKFSLRVDFARTDCRQAVANEEKLAAELEFPCCSQGPLRSVRVTTDPPMPVSYLRDVRPMAGTRNRGIKCIEEGMFAEGMGAIRSTQFSGEDVFLQLGADKPKPKIPGLLLDDIVVDGGPRVLTRDDVVYRLTVQRAQGKMQTTPTLSSNAIAIDKKKLGDLKFRQATIEVLK
jgi:hypothetical protein